MQASCTNTNSRGNPPARSARHSLPGERELPAGGHPSMSIYNSIRSQFAGYAGGLSVHRRLCVREPYPVLAEPARLARHAGDDLVRLFLSRSAARDAGARWPGGCAGRRPRKPGHQRGAAARAGHWRQAAAAHLDLHERVRLPREPQSGRRQDRENRLSARASSSTPISTRRAPTTSAIRW